MYKPQRASMGISPHNSPSFQIVDGKNGKVSTQLNNGALNSIRHKHPNAVRLIEHIVADLKSQRQFSPPITGYVEIALDTNGSQGFMLQEITDLKSIVSDLQILARGFDVAIAYEPQHKVVHVALNTCVLKNGSCIKRFPQ
jgi:hypothetical protein